MSALPTKAAAAVTEQRVRYGPTSDPCTAAKIFLTRPPSRQPVSLNQRWNLSGNRNLQHGRRLFCPGFGGGLFDRVNVVKARGIAAITSRERDDVETGQVKAWNTRRLHKDRKRFENSVFLVAHDNDHPSRQFSFCSA